MASTMLKIRAMSVRDGLCRDDKDDVADIERSPHMLVQPGAAHGDERCVCWWRSCLDGARSLAFAVVRRAGHAPAHLASLSRLTPAYRASTVGTAVIGAC